jgi:hypothetical protein
MNDVASYPDAFERIAETLGIREASWLLEGDLVPLDELLLRNPPTLRLAVITYDAEDHAYGMECFDTAPEACEAAAALLTGLPGYLVAIADLAVGRCMHLGVSVSVI